MKKIIAFFLLLALMLGSTACALTYDELIQKAGEYITVGDYDKAIACYNLAMKDDPDNITAYIKAALLYLDTGNVSDARILIENALSVDATLPDAWLAKCRVDIAIGDSEAFDSDRLYAEICGADLSGYVAEIGELYAKAGSVDKALSYFSKADVGSLTVNQKKLYRRMLIASGEKGKATALGLDPVHIRDEELDAVFSSGIPKLVEINTEVSNLSLSDLNLTEDAVAAYEEYPLSDPRKEIEKSLPKSSAVLFSKSPNGNSGLYSIGEIAVTMFEGKYHMVYPSLKRSVKDEYFNLYTYSHYYADSIAYLICEEGISYSPDGKYAATYNYRNYAPPLMLLRDPIILDLSTGELILIDTSPNKWEDNNSASYVISTVFSSDGEYFYYLLVGKFGDNRMRLCRYDLAKHNIETCFETEDYFTDSHISELNSGDILILNGSGKTGGQVDFYLYNPHNDELKKIVKQSEGIKNYLPSRIMKYSANSGRICMINNTSISLYNCAFQIVDLEDDFAGIDKYYFLSKETSEIVCLTEQEYLSYLESIDDGKDFARNYYSQQKYRQFVTAVFSPDGNYLMLRTDYYKNKDNQMGNLYLVRLDDMVIQKVRGIDVDEINVIPRDYPINIEWNTEAVIIGTRSGIKTYSFVAGGYEDLLLEIDTRTEEEKKIDETKEAIEKQRNRVKAAEAQLQRWIEGGKKSEEDINKQRGKIQREKDKLKVLEEELLELENSSK